MSFSKPRIPFTALPPELKLQILSYVSITTLRKIVSNVSKEFRELSRDFSLYQRYVSPECDMFGLITKAELDNDIHKAHLKALVVGDEGWRQISGIKFSSLRILRIYFNSHGGVLLSMIRALDYIPHGLQSLDIAGPVISDRVKEHFASVLKAKFILHPVEDDIDMMKKCVDFALFIRAFDFTEMVDALQQHEVMEDVELATLILRRSEDIPGILNPKFTELLTYHLRFLNWQLSDVASEHDHEVLSVLCKVCVNLTYFKLEFVHISSISRLSIDHVASTRLRTFSLQNTNSVQTSIKADDLNETSLAIIFNAVLENIYLKNLFFHSLPAFNEHVRNLLFECCSLPFAFLLNFHGKYGCIRISDSIVTGGLSLMHRHFQLEYLYINNCSLSTVYNVLTAFNCAVKKLEIRFKNRTLVERLDEMSSMLKGVQSIDIIPYVILNLDSPVHDISSILEAMAASNVKLRCLTYRSLECSSLISDRVLRLLQHFPQLESVQLIGESQFSATSIKQHFPHALVVSGRYGLLGNVHCFYLR